MTEELKPCPFCGKDAHVGHYGNSFDVQCNPFNGCSVIPVSEKIFKTKQEAIKAWNRRA